MTYLITVACYGCHLRGGESGSVDPAHNVPGTPTLEDYPAGVAAGRKRMNRPPAAPRYLLEAIQEMCAHRGWSLLAAHVRTNRVHTVVEAEVPPTRVMSGFKAYAGRHLNRMGLD